MSSGPASATSARGVSVEGSMVAKYRPLFGSTNSPPMNRPYRESIETMSRDSGAVAYSHEGPAVGRVSARGSIRSVMTSVDREVVRTLIPAGALLVDLHEHVVQERGGADPKELGRHPVRTERLVQQHEVLDGLLRLPHPTGGLEPHAAPSLVVEVADGLHH